MKIELDPKRYERCLITIDSHTMGEATRIIVEGVPRLEGKTMMEKKLSFKNSFDHLRTALMLEPRGHSNMFGALLTEPADSGADIGAIFMDTGGYLNMCGHGSMGAAVAVVEAGIVKAEPPLTTIRLDTPAGIIKAEVSVENCRAKEVNVYTVPSFLYKEGVKLSLPEYGEIKLNIAFGGSFFALVNSIDLGLCIRKEYIGRFVDLGMKILRATNEAVDVKHPLLPINTVDLVEFYETEANSAFQKNIVVFGDGQFDRSPCGTGTAARIAELYTKGRIPLGEEITNESITGAMFRGAAVKETFIGEFQGVIPRITGQAYITGINRWLLDRDDPLKYGFLIHA